MCSPQIGHREKDMKSKVAAKKWLWWKVNSKNFNNDNSGKFVLPSLEFGTKFTWIFIIKIFAINLHHSHFLAATLNFTSFFTMAFMRPHSFFYSCIVFGLHFASFCMLQSWQIAINGCCYLSSFFPFCRQILAVFHMCIMHTFYLKFIYFFTCQWLQVNFKQQLIDVSHSSTGTCVINRLLSDFQLSWIL